MLNRPKSHRYSSKGEYSEFNTSFSSKTKQNNSFTITPKPTFKTQKPSTNPSRQRNISQYDSKNSKPLSRDPKIDFEKLAEDHWNYRFRLSVHQEENTKLKMHLEQLIQEQDLESTQEIPKLKTKIRKLQSKLTYKEDQILKLKANIKSCKIKEQENDIESYIDEAKRLMFLLESVASDYSNINSSEYEGHKSHMAIELQSLRKENIQLSKSTTQTLHELDILKGKLKNLDKHKHKKGRKAKIIKFKQQKSQGIKDLNNIIEEYHKSEKELIEKIRIEKDHGKEKLIELEAYEKKISEQDRMISEMKQKFERFKNASKARKTLTFMPMKFRDEALIKLINPPRLLVKINQILKKKKMLVTVFLSLLDKNNNGLLHINAFFSGMKEYGQKIKPKHIQEISKLLGSSLTYIPLIKIEEMYEKYKYDNEYKSSSSEDELPIRKKSQQRTPSPPKPIIVSSYEVRKDSYRPLPSPVKEIEVKPIPAVSVNEIMGILDEIKEKMCLSKLPKSKLVTALFGYDFDPDEGISIEILMEFLVKSQLGLNNGPMVRLLARFLIEPDGLKAIKENEIPKLRGTIRGMSRKLIKILPDWDVFNDKDVDGFRKLLNDQMKSNWKKIKKAFEDDDDGKSGFIEFLRMQNLLRNLEVVFTEKMNFWLMMELGVKNKHDKFEYRSFLKNYEELEPNFIVKDHEAVKTIEESPKEIRESVMIETLRKLVDKINETKDFIFSNIDLTISAEDFINLIYAIDIVIPSNILMEITDEFSIESNERFTKVIDMKGFKCKLEELGLCKNLLENNGVVKKENKEKTSQDSDEIYKDYYEVKDQMSIHSAKSSQSSSEKNFSNKKSPSNYIFEENSQENPYTDDNKSSESYSQEESPKSEVSEYSPDHEDHDSLYSSHSNSIPLSSPSKSSLHHNLQASHESSISYDDQFLSSTPENIEKGVQLHSKNETELVFIEYGIHMPK
ncbi:hypothetical protein SteCoe_21616 [Stentor coeruleus]|uniref:EF-hand domain-containing protein n=1 Tax=Stentor coeruleus TaxID=5963 RepID=A0A1R2BP28_9CILI|nr:hypothetical protein SteCoe_21616 [Stentor coeruleus]